MGGKKDERLELATIKPSEHLELLIYRFERIAGDHPDADVGGTILDQCDELFRLLGYLKESGQ